MEDAEETHVGTGALDQFSIHASGITPINIRVSLLLQLGVRKHFTELDLSKDNLHIITSGAVL